MLVLKVGAYLATGSSAILGDAAESVVHVGAVAFAAFSLRLSLKPPDANHPYGHAKISFFSAGFEGGLIVLAALYIIGSSIVSLLSGPQLQNLDLGIGLTVAAVLINGVLGAYLIRIGRRRQSLILIANGRHVLTDCWTSIGVVIGVLMAMITGWLQWDPIFGIIMGANIIRAGLPLLRESIAGLLDEADPSIRAEIEALLDEETRRRGISYHALRHRRSGDGYSIDVHLLFPENMTIGEAHRFATEIERVLEQNIKPSADVHTHLEPLEGHDSAHLFGHADSRGEN